MPESYSSLRTQADVTIEELKALLREAEQALGEAGGEANDQVQALRDRVRHALDSGKTNVRHLAAAARNQVSRTDDMIHERPYAAMGVAAGVGFIVGYLVCRSCSSDDDR